MIILLNGAPSSGKDTVANYLTQKFQTRFHKEKFAQPLKAAVGALFGMSEDEWKKIDDCPTEKNVKREQFYGKSWRDLCIEMSEIYVKPNYDKAFFGHSFVTRTKKYQNYNWLVSDSGFSEEAVPVIKHYGEEEVSVIRIVRPGFTFVNDSRSYWDIPEEFTDVRLYILENVGSVMELLFKSESLVESILGDK